MKTTQVPFEIDHVFVSVSRRAPEAERLLEVGFAEGPPNSHPGQGTACRRVFFQDSYVELVWLESLTEATGPSVERTGLVPRTQMTEGVSRIGIALRSSGHTEVPLPFETWDYRPPYLPEGMVIPVALSSSELREPLIFFVPANSPSDRRTVHPNGARAVSDVHLILAPTPKPSSALKWLADSGCAKIDYFSKEHLTVELDGGVQNQILDLSPVVPLCLKW